MNVINIFLPRRSAGNVVLTQILILAFSINVAAGEDERENVFTPRQGVRCREQAVLKSPDALSGDRFGASLSISDGCLMVGASGGRKSEGAAYVFNRSSDGRWGDSARIKVRDTSAGDYFGAAVAIDGGRAIVGACRDDDGGWDSGSAYVFRRASDGKWKREVKIRAGNPDQFDRFGSSVSLCGDLAVVGASRDEEGAHDAGAVYVFRRRTDGAWEQAAKLTSNDARAGDFLGRSVSFHGDCAIIGAWGRQNRAGMAQVFLLDPTGRWRYLTKLSAPTPRSDAAFGWSVRHKGDYAVVGAVGENKCGAVYIFECCADGAWRQVCRLSPPDGAFEGDFGCCVSLGDGLVAIGAPGAGKVYVYFQGRDGQWRNAAILAPPDKGRECRFGEYVCLCGKYLAVGMPGGDDGCGRVYVYTVAGAGAKATAQPNSANNAGNEEGNKDAVEYDYRLAKLYADNGQEEKAIRMLKKIIKKYPKSPYATKARKLLSEM